MKIKSKKELTVAIGMGPVSKDNVSKSLAKVLERWQAAKQIAIVGDHIVIYGISTHYRLLGMAAFRAGMHDFQSLSSAYEPGRAYKALWQHFSRLKVTMVEQNERHEHWLQGWELGRAEQIANQNQD